MLGTVYNTRHLPKRRDERIIIHFDYDCFYASVFEAENPALKSIPLAVQQKQIIVTCNYEARRRGLSKLQLITEAKKACPDLVIVLGEDLTRFRNASKALYNFLKGFSWNGKVEKLGFDEVWMDVTDLISYNVECLNPNNLSNSFFQLSLSDPTVGFPFDASRVIGHTYPKEAEGLKEHTLCFSRGTDEGDGPLTMRLILGSHLALYLRNRLDHEKGYTSTVGISTSKLLSKLIGNMHKPNSQTTLLPPYETCEEGRSNVYTFLDSHDIGKVPWIGFKLAQKLRQHILRRPAGFDDGLIYGGTKEQVTVGQLRLGENLSPRLLDKILSGPGTPQNIGNKVFELIHGVDDVAVANARAVPRQISIEDSYIRLDDMSQVFAQFRSLSTKLIKRMLIDLVDEESPEDFPRWLAFPTTLRLSTRPRLPLNADGTRTRTFKRISKSCPIPSFLARPFRASDVEILSKRLIAEYLVPLFRKLHPEKHGWNLSLVNVAVTGMSEGGLSGNGVRNIDAIFKRVEDHNEGLPEPITELSDSSECTSLQAANIEEESCGMSKQIVTSSGDAQASHDHIEFGNREDHDNAVWYDDDEDDDDDDEAIIVPTLADDEDEAEAETRAPPQAHEYLCKECNSIIPTFARFAHDRFHAYNGT